MSITTQIPLTSIQVRVPTEGMVMFVLAVVESDGSARAVDVEISPAEINRPISEFHQRIIDPALAFLRR